MINVQLVLAHVTHNKQHIFSTSSFGVNISTNPLLPFIELSQTQ